MGPAEPGSEQNPEDRRRADDKTAWVPPCRDKKSVTCSDTTSVPHRERQPEVTLRGDEVRGAAENCGDQEIVVNADAHGRARRPAYEPQWRAIRQPSAVVDGGGHPERVTTIGRDRELVDRRASLACTPPGGIVPLDADPGHRRIGETGRVQRARPGPDWSQTTVLVTGATGFLGQHVTARLVTAGAQVVGTTRRPRFDRDGVRWAVVDLNDADELCAAVDETRPDVVFHLGGYVSAAVDPAVVVPTFTTLLTSSVGLLTAADQGRMGRLVLIGSVDEPRTGTTPMSPYGAAKAAVRSYARLYASAFATPVVIARLTDVYGPGQASSKLLPHVADAVLRGDRPRLSNCERRTDWIYVDDVVEGLLAAARDAPPGAEIDLGSGIVRQDREVVRGLIAALGSSIEPVWGALPDRAVEQNRAADVDQARLLLGWSARVTLTDGLRRTAAAARERRITTDDGSQIAADPSFQA